MANTKVLFFLDSHMQCTSRCHHQARRANHHCFINTGRFPSHSLPASCTNPGTRSLVWGAGSKTFACVGFWVFMWVAGGVPSLMWVGRSLMWASGCSPGRLGGPGARVWAALVWSMRRHRQRLCVRVSGMWSIGRSCGPLTLMWSVSSGHVVYACSCGRSPSLRWPMSLAHVGPA